MKVFIAGGTGFIGYHAALEFLKRGYEVSSIALPDMKPGEWFPKEIKIEYGNLFEMKESELVELLTGYDSLIYALGPDDRFVPKAPAYDFFHEYLVKKCGLIIAAARKAGIKKCVVMNSYFTYFDQKFPGYKLSAHHPYIKCRVEQAERVINEGKDKMDVVVLELPYIFGTMPGREPLWKDVLNKMGISRRIILYPKGGSNMVSVEHVAEAVAGATEYGVHGKCYLIGDANLSWVEMLGIMTSAMGYDDKKIITVPCFFATLFGVFQKLKNYLKGKESGLDYSHLFRDFLCREYFFDPSDSSLELGYSRGGIKQSIEETIEAIISNK